MAGNNSNNGTSLALAKATIAGLPQLFTGNLIYLVNGSTWREQLGLVAALSNTSVTGTGSGNLAVLNGSDVIAPASFTASIHADAGGVVYEYSWTRGTGTERGTDAVMLWEGDTRLVRKSSVALCAATAGTFYPVNEEGATSLIYVHPYGNTNPISDGKTYNVTIRGAGLDTYPASSVTITNIHAMRSWGHYGPLNGGPSSTIQRCIVEGGGVHHIVTAGSLAEDVVLFDQNLSPVAGGIAMTFYRPVASSSDAVARRVFWTGNIIEQNGNSGFFAHDDGTNWRSVLFDQCVCQYSGTFSALTQDLTITNSAVLQGANNPISLDTKGTILVQRVMVYDGLAPSGGLVSFTGLAVAGPRTASIKDSVITITAVNAAANAIYYRDRAGTLLIENCVIYYDGAVGTNAVNVSGYDASNRLTVTMRNCIIYTRNACNMVLTVNTADYTGDNNIFYRVGGTAQFNYQGVSKSGLAAWQSASGTDSTSIEADPGFSGNPASGDFRLTPGGNADTRGCGPRNHWNYRTRSIDTGAPIAWPVIPANRSDAETYMSDPTAWAF